MGLAGECTQMTRTEEPSPGRVLGKTASDKWAADGAQRVYAVYTVNIVRRTQTRILHSSDTGEETAVPQRDEIRGDDAGHGLYAATADALYGCRNVTRCTVMNKRAPSRAHLFRR